MRADPQEERDQLLADAKHEADHYREQSRKATEQAMQQRVRVLEQLMGVYRDLEEVPAALESAYRELKNSPTAELSLAAETVPNQAIFSAPCRSGPLG